MSLLEVRDIHTYYGDSHVLQGIDLQTGEGKVVTILGRNGAGKTTLLRSIMGFNPPRSGSILFKGREISRLGIHHIARLGVGLVPQGRRVFSSLSVREHLDIAWRPGAHLHWSVDDVLSMFPNLRDRLHSRARTLSGGEQQLLACGRALVGNPDLLLMDEPSEGLAPLLVREIARIIGQIKSQGISVLLVEQDASFALAVADHAYVMSRGMMVHESEPEKLRENWEIRSRYLGV